MKRASKTGISNQGCKTGQPNIDGSAGSVYIFPAFTGVMVQILDPKTMSLKGIWYVLKTQMTVSIK